VREYGLVSNIANDRRIDYIEFPSTDLAKTKSFYSGVFGWQFEDWGADYISFHDGRLAGGFFSVQQMQGYGPLVVIYAANLAAMAAKVVEAGGVIIKPAFEFPGGRRFHFTDPSGNALAVWTDL
jgi:predicted enzyme related to lactoylglutathione lyase